MAEEETKEEATVDKITELERLLNDEEEVVSSKGSLVDTLKEKLKSKKILISLAIFLLLSFLGGGYLLLKNDTVIPEEKSSELDKEKIEKTEIEDDASINKKEVEEINRFKQVIVYPLESFFIPLEFKNQNFSQFVSLKLTFVMSNRKLNKEIDKNVAEIRKQIYEILRNKQSRAYIENKTKIKEMLKREILTASNSLLSSGEGTISDVLFTDFIIK